MIIHEAIVLAGGLGTRLQDAIPGIPKCMAPVHQKPFLDYVIQYLQSQGVTRFVFALGHQAEMVVDYLQSHPLHHSFAYSIETTALGTGGAIQLALQHCKEENVLIVNGDTLYKTLIENIARSHSLNKALCTITLKPMQNTSRYGAVVIDDTNKVTGFREKLQSGAGLINGGMYIINRKAFLDMDWPESFSFEKDFLQTHVRHAKIFAAIDDGYFIDIGIPEDYERAKQELVDGLVR
jgi:D-glycero-alpha-D-manno-heptose 1-phosphate guanylyltransferase